MGVGCLSELCVLVEGGLCLRASGWLVRVDFDKVEVYQVGCGLRDGYVGFFRVDGGVLRCWGYVRGGGVVKRELDLCDPGVVDQVCGFFLGWGGDLWV